MLDRIRAIDRPVRDRTRRTCRFRAAPCAPLPTTRRGVLERIGPKPPADIAVRRRAAWSSRARGWSSITSPIGSTLIGFRARRGGAGGVGGAPGPLHRRAARRRAPSVPGNVRARGPVRASLDEADVSRSASREAKRSHLRRRRLSAAARHPLLVPSSTGSPFDFYRQIRARNPSPYMFFIENGRPGGLRRVARVSRASRRAQGAHASARRDALARRRRPKRTTRSQASCSPTKRSAPNTSCWSISGATISGAVCEIGSVRVDELMEIERYSHVMHIVSNVVGELRDDKRRARSVRGGVFRPAP